MEKDAAANTIDENELQPQKCNSFVVLVSERSFQEIPVDRQKVISAIYYFFLVTLDFFSRKIVNRKRVGLFYSKRC